MLLNLNIRSYLKILSWAGHSSDKRSNPVGFLVQKFIRGRAAGMGRKTASLYKDDPLFSAKTSINMGHIFIFLKNIGSKIGLISSIWYKNLVWNLLESLTILKNSNVILFCFFFFNSKFVALILKWVSFSAKFGVKMGLLFKSQQHVPTQIILE